MMKKRTKWILAIALGGILVGGVYFYLDTSRLSSKDDLYGMCATCVGSGSCSACKNCKYCRHCAKNGGSCGVCQ